MATPAHDRDGRRVVITPAERLDGSAMQQSGGGVRDLKLIYPETGFDAMTLCLGVVEIDPGHHSPLHRHRCEEVYYVASGAGELESDGQRYPLTPGCAVLNHPGVVHRVHNTGAETLRLVVVAGIMLVPLLPRWPTPSPYEVFEGSTAPQHPPLPEQDGSSPQPTAIEAEPAVGQVEEAAVSDSFRVDQLDHVELFVPDRYEAAAWYGRTLGLAIVPEYEHWADHPHGPLMLSTAGAGTKLALFAGEPQGDRPTAGFHRVAYRVSRAGFEAFLAHVRDNPVFDDAGREVRELAVRDHGQARSVYFRDPYGHRFEVTTYEVSPG